MWQTIICTAARRNACNCIAPEEMVDCGHCGFEQTELLRRKEAIRQEGLTVDKETGKYCLKLRKERKHD